MIIKLPVIDDFKRNRIAVASDASRGAVHEHHVVWTRLWTFGDQPKFLADCRRCHRLIIVVDEHQRRGHWAWSRRREHLWLIVSEKFYFGISTKFQFKSTNLPPTSPPLPLNPLSSLFLHHSPPLSLHLFITSSLLPPLNESKQKIVDLLCIVNRRYDH